jgi:hypothetical protein
MKWIPVSKPVASLSEYHLVEEGNILAILKYNPLQQSARIRSGEKQQVFFMERSGSNANKLIVENEYGVRTGYYAADSVKNKSGNIAVHDTHYHFKLLTGSIPEFSIYKPGTFSPLVICPIALSAGQATASVECSSLLLALCWYLSQSHHSFLSPVSQKQKDVKPVAAFVID